MSEEVDLLAGLRNGAWLDQQVFPPLTASTAVESGECSGACLVAPPESFEQCDCRCGGRFHGALADALGHDLEHGCVCGPMRFDFAPQRWLYVHERLSAALRGDT